MVERLIARVAVHSLASFIMSSQAKKRADDAARLDPNLIWLNQSDTNIRLLIEGATVAGQGNPLPELMKRAYSEDDAVRTIAIQALSLLLSQLPEAEERASILKAFTDALHDGLQVESKAALSQRGYFIPDHRSALRGAAAEALATFADATVLNGLITALHLEHAGARRNGALGLSRVADPRTVPFLAKALDDTVPDVRDAAMNGLRRINTAEALAAIEAWRKQRGLA